MVSHCLSVILWITPDNRSACLPCPSLTDSSLTIPRETRVVDDDMDLAIAKVGCFLHEIVDVFVVEDIARNRGGLAASLVDALGD